MTRTDSHTGPERPDDPGTGGGNRFLLGALAAGHLVNDWVAGTIWLIAPAIAASMGLGPAEIGIIIAVNGIAAGLTYIPAGMVADRVSNSGVLMLITFWWVAAGYFASTLMPGFWLVTLFLVIGVMGDAFWHPVATGVLVKTMPTRRGQVLGIHAVGGSVGAEILAPITIGILLTYFTWQTSLQIATIPAILMGVLFIFIAPKISFASKKSTRTDRLGKILSEWATRRGVLMMGMMVCYNMSLFAMLSMTPVTLQQRYGMSAFDSSVMFASMLVIGTLFQPFVGKLSDAAGRSRPIVVIISLATVCAAGAGLFEVFAPFMLSLICAVSLLTAVRPIILAAAVELSGKSESTTLGIVFAVLDGVGALGALIAGFSGELDLAFAFMISAVLAMLSIILYLSSGMASGQPAHHSNA